MCKTVITSIRVTVLRERNNPLTLVLRNPRTNCIEGAQIAREARSPPSRAPPATAAYLLPPEHGHVWKRSSADFPAELLTRWLWIWSGWWNVVCVRPLLGDVEVAMAAAAAAWEEIVKLQTLKMRLLSWPRRSPLFLLTAAFFFSQL